MSKYLIVGLGNPGRKYSGNRHNIGFMLIDQLARAHGISLSRVQQRAVVGTGRIVGKAVILAKPQTMMNLSGDSVGPLANFYRIPAERIIVAYDDLDLPLGYLRLRKTGGSGGHNGVSSLINHLGKQFVRVRMGIDRPSGSMPPAAYVLQDFGRNERDSVDAMLDDAVRAVVAILRDGIDNAMNQHNTRKLSVDASATDTSS